MIAIHSAVTPIDDSTASYTTPPARGVTAPPAPTSIDVTIVLPIDSAMPSTAAMMTAATIVIRRARRRFAASRMPAARSASAIHGSQVTTPTVRA